MGRVTKEFAQIAARYISHWEIIEYATDSKIDVPSGTVRELATKLEQIKDLRFQTSTEKYIGETSARGATVNGTQIHSVRLPGFTLGVDIVFGAANQTLIISHSSSNSALPYVEGALLAIRKVKNLVGVHRGLDVL